jgi:NAD(P)-dependent dehydrogenase (short-subunit alcohol dehydrogenase family)
MIDLALALAPNHECPDHAPVGCERHKLGLSGLTAELAVQWARHGIRVNTVAPGFFRSEITDGMYDDERSLTWLQHATSLSGKRGRLRRGGLVARQ